VKLPSTYSAAIVLNPARHLYSYEAGGSVDKRGFYLPPRHKDTKNHQEKLLSGHPLFKALSNKGFSKGISKGVIRPSDSPIYLPPLIKTQMV